MRAPKIILREVDLRMVEPNVRVIRKRQANAVIEQEQAYRWPRGLAAPAEAEAALLLSVENHFLELSRVAACPARLKKLCTSGLH